MTWSSSFQALLCPGSVKRRKRREDAWGWVVGKVKGPEGENAYMTYISIATH